MLRHFLAVPGIAACRDEALRSGRRDFSQEPSGRPLGTSRPAKALEKARREAAQGPKSGMQRFPQRAKGRSLQSLVDKPAAKAYYIHNLLKGKLYENHKILIFIVFLLQLLLGADVLIASFPG